jgi:hypothetical protein
MAVTDTPFIFTDSIPLSRNCALVYSWLDPMI